MGEALPDTPTIPETGVSYDWLTLDTWIISDTHFRHGNIIAYCNRPYNHDELMVENWESLVAPHEPILHLGDVFSWYGENDAREIIAALPGDIHFIPGNHDRKTQKKIAKAGWTRHRPFITELDGSLVAFTHYPLASPPEFDVNIHGHIHNNGWTIPLSDHQIRVNVSVEVINYRPVRLRDVLELNVGEIQSRSIRDGRS